MKRCALLVQRFGADIQIHGMQINGQDQQWVCIVKRVVGRHAGDVAEGHGATKDAAIAAAELQTGPWPELDPLEDTPRDLPPERQLPPELEALLGSPVGFGDLLGFFIGSLIGRGIEAAFTPARPKGQKCRNCRCDHQTPEKDDEGVLRCPCCEYLWIDEDQPRLAKGGKMKDER